MKFSSALRDLRNEYIHTNSVGFEHSTYLLIASVREKNNYAGCDVMWFFNIQDGGRVIGTLRGAEILKPRWRKLKLVL